MTAPDRSSPETPERIRVTMMIDEIGPDSAGGERFAMGLARTLPRDRFAVTLCVTRRADPGTRAEMEAAGVEVLELGRRGRFDLRSFGPLVRRLRSGSVDVLHAHKFGSNVWGTLFGRAAGTAVLIAHEQTWSYAGNRLRVALDFLIGRAVSAMVAVSSADRERMIAVERIPAEKIVMIPNAYIPRGDPAPAGSLRREIGAGPDTPLVGTVAVLRPQKALTVLVDAFAKLAPAHPRARLVIGGDGPCRAELADRVADAGLGDRVDFIGMREDVEGVVGDLDVVAMSSDFEGTPLFALEAMATGTPLVATRVGGLPDIVEDGVSGLLVAPRDPAALGDAIASVLEDADLRARLSDGALERSREFTIERAAERFAALYESLLAESRRRA